MIRGDKTPDVPPSCQRREYLDPSPKSIFYIYIYIGVLFEVDVETISPDPINLRTNLPEGDREGRPTKSKPLTHTRPIIRRTGGQRVFRRVPGSRRGQRRKEGSDESSDRTLT